MSGPADPRSGPPFPSISQGGGGPQDANSPLVDLVEVSKRFPGVRALDQASVQLWPGEVHALVGENGAGKSTLIKVLTGAYQPDGGEVRYRGEPVRFESPMAAQAAGISTIYQEVN